MNLHEFTPKPIDEYELLTNIVKHIQFKFDLFHKNDHVIHLNSSVKGLTQVEKVVSFKTENEWDKYFYSNGRTTKAAIVILGGVTNVGVLLNGERYFCVLRVYRGHINIEYHKDGSVLPSHRKAVFALGEENLRAGFLDLEGQCASKLVSKS
jgi:hypothetical protein